VIGDNAFAAISPKVNVTEGEIYTFSFYAKANGLDGLDGRPSATNWRTKINWYDGNNTLIAWDMLTDTTLYEDWKRYIITAQAPTGAVKAEVIIGGDLPNFSYVGAKAYFKNIQLEQKAYATSFIDGIRAAEKLTIPTAGVLNPQEGTVEFWVKLSCLNPIGYNAFFTSGDVNAPGPRILIMREFGGDVVNKIRVWDGDGSSEAVLTSVTTLQAGIWYYVAFTWSPSGRKLYVNGVLEASNTRSNNLGFATLAKIGSWYSRSYLNGLIDDLRISSRARTDEEIAAAYASNQPLPVDEWTTCKMSFDGNLIYFAHNPFNNKILVSSNYKPEWSKIKNYWKVIGYSDSTTGKIYNGSCQNNNPESPTNTAAPPNGIGIKAEVLTDTNLTTDSLCEQRAAYELRKNLSTIDVSSHEILPLPFLNEGDCIQLEDTEAGITNAKYQIQTITEPLGLGLMELECWKCVTIFELVASDDFQSGLGLWQQLSSGVVDIYGIGGNNCLRKQTYADPNGGYRLLSKSIIDFELVLYTRRDATGTGANSYSLTDTSGNGYGISLDYTSNQLTIDKRSAWARTILASVAVTPTLANWYTLRLIKLGSNLTAEIYNDKVTIFSNPLAAVGTADGSYTSFDRVAVNGGYVFYTDDVRVRRLL